MQAWGGEGRRGDAEQRKGGGGGRKEGAGSGPGGGLGYQGLMKRRQEETGREEKKTHSWPCSWNSQHLAQSRPMTRISGRIGEDRTGREDGRRREEAGRVAAWFLPAPSPSEVPGPAAHVRLSGCLFTPCRPRTPPTAERASQLRRQFSDWVCSLSKKRWPHLPL